MEQNTNSGFLVFLQVRHNKCFTTVQSTELVQVWDLYLFSYTGNICWIMLVSCSSIEIMNVKKSLESNSKHLKYMKSKN